MKLISCIDLKQRLDFNASFIKGPGFSPQLVYQTIFILDELFGLIKFQHQLHSKLNVALILKLYIFRCFYQFSNGMADLVQVSLATNFLAFYLIFCRDSIRFLLCLSTILFFPLRWYLIWTMVFCAFSLIILISRWIEAYFLYFYNKSRALFNYS